MKNNYCDSLAGEIYMAHPYKMLSMPNIKRELKRALEKEKTAVMSHYLVEPMKLNWIDTENNAAKHMVSPMMNFLSSHYFM